MWLAVVTKYHIVSKNMLLDHEEAIVVPSVTVAFETCSWRVILWWAFDLADDTHHFTEKGALLVRPLLYSLKKKLHEEEIAWEDRERYWNSSEETYRQNTTSIK
jgi:uncharacterized Fe-S radical SAM superfamily protein PflX